MTERPMFSVLTATHNHAPYLAEALDSVERQTGGDYEIVVIDDGSTDATPLVLSEWSRGFERRRANRIVTQRIPNSGQSAALAHGFAACRGRYVCLLDSDDRWTPHKLETVAAAVAADPSAGMIVHPLYVIDCQGRRTGDVRPRAARLSAGDLRAQLRRTCRHAAPATSGLVIRSEVFASLLPMPTTGFSFAADSYLAFGASLAAPVVALAEPLGEYRMQEHSTYLRVMLTPKGLAQQVELQRTIARHFDLLHVLHRDSFFARNDFALARLTAGEAWLRRYWHLISATAGDGAFTVSQRARLIAWWTACALAPAGAFTRMWRWFLLKSTGWDRILRRAPA